MTPRQRQAHIAALAAAASAPRKAWLGRFTLLTGIQRGWIQSMLTVWGECVGGKTRGQYRLANCDQFWSKVKEASWSEGQLSQITDALKQARTEGYKGIKAAQRARAILWPVTLQRMIEDTARKDDADFIEQAVLAAFSTDDPVYIIGMSYYTTRKKISDLARELLHMAPWLTTDEARKRVRWCIQIFEARTFLEARNQQE